MNNDRYIVCERCLEAIESHEGSQITQKIDAWEICDENEMVRCSFCEEEFRADEADVMYEVFQRWNM